MSRPLAQIAYDAYVAAVSQHPVDDLSSRAQRARKFKGYYQLSNLERTAWAEVAQAVIDENDEDTGIL